MVIIIVFRLGSDKLVCCLFYSLSSSAQSGDVTPRLEEVDDISCSIVQVHFTFC